jgi:hypothetical protein
MENPPQKESTPTTPPAASKPVPEKRTNWRVLPIFVLGIVAGLGLAIAWPKLAPLATCLQDVAQNEVPIPTGTEGDADWIKIYGEVKPVTKYDRMFSPTYNQLLDFYFKFRRPPSPIKWSDIERGGPAPYPNGPPSQEAQDAYQAQLQEWQQRMCEIEGLCPAQTDKSGAAASPYSDIAPGYHVVPSTPAATTR